MHIGVRFSVLICCPQIATIKVGDGLVISRCNSDYKNSYERLVRSIDELPCKDEVSYFRLSIDYYTTSGPLKVAEENSMECTNRTYNVRRFFRTGGSIFFGLCLLP